MRLMPREPFCQIAAKAARPTRIESPAQRQRAEERRQRRLHLEEAEADDQDRDHHRDHGEYREVARPGGEAGHGLRLVGSGKPAGHRSKSAGLGACRANGTGRDCPFETTALRQIQGSEWRIGSGE